MAGPRMTMLPMVAEATVWEAVWDEPDGSWFEVAVDRRGRAFTYCCTRDPRDIYGLQRRTPIVRGELP